MLRFSPPLSEYTTGEKNPTKGSFKHHNIIPLLFNSDSFTIWTVSQAKDSFRFQTLQLILAQPKIVRF